jgi:GDP-L-fucose synthase
MTKKILLTGAGPRGFVGRNLKEALKEKFEIYTPGSNELDLCDYEATAWYIDKNKIDTVIHASSSFENVLDSDLRMYFNLEKLSRDIDRMIYFGSGAEFDKRYDIVMASENDIGKRIPNDGYGFAKYIMTTHARLSRNVYCLRLFGIFGKYEDWTYKFISNICCKAVFSLPLTIRRECKFDYIYIDDLPNIVECFLGNELKYHDYNFTYGSPVLLTELAQLVLKASGKDLEVVMLNPDGFNNEYTSSNERLTNEISSFKPTRLEIAVEKLYRYYVNNKHLIDRELLSQTR